MTTDEAVSGRPRWTVLRVMAGVLISVLIGLGLMMILVPLFARVRVSEPPAERFCGIHLVGLAKAIIVYAGDHAGTCPTPSRWCDLLVQDANVPLELFRCPVADTPEGQSSYAMNKHLLAAKLAEAPLDQVVLFESKSGWNQAGGPEMLNLENHDGEGCYVAFVGGHAEYVRVARISKLRWRSGTEQPPELRNSRRPENDEEFRYWLENMICHHGFLTEEVLAATGVTASEIQAAQDRFGIRPGERPVREPNAPLLVLPYPGGRHPRIGFLEGAIDPQRETKFSAFTPWDPNSYVVVDVPEAIWSNLGLTYLAHTHIDTIWTKQGIELPKLEWNRRTDGSLDIERTLPNGIAFGVKAMPDREAVHMEMWLQNGADETLSDLRVQICVMPKMAAGFAQQTNENKVFTNPYVACRSQDGQRWIITAWEGCDRPWGNEQCPCFHSDPKFPDLEPGQKAKLRGWLSFYEGEDVQAEFRRIEATGWREN